MARTNEAREEKEERALVVPLRGMPSSASRSVHAMRLRSRQTKHLQKEKRTLRAMRTEGEDDDDDEEEEHARDERKTKAKIQRTRIDRRVVVPTSVEREEEEEAEEKREANLSLFPFLGKRMSGRAPMGNNNNVNEKTSIRKQCAENVYKLVVQSLQSGDFELAARTTAALLAISRKRMYREEETENGGRKNAAEEEEEENDDNDFDEEEKEKRRKRKTLNWHPKVARDDWEMCKKHERMAMKSCLELMSGARGDVEEEEEERDAREIYTNLVKEASIGGERQQARFERAFGEFFRAARRKAREARKSLEREKALRKAKMRKENVKNRKALPRAGRFGGYGDDDGGEEEKAEEEVKELNINLEPEVADAVRLLEGRGVKIYNFTDSEKRKLLQSSMRSLTDAAMLKFALWFESIKDKTVQRHVLRLEMCRTPLTSKEIEMKRRGKSITNKTLDARAKSGAFGDDSLRTNAVISITGLLEARATNNNTNNNGRGEDIGAEFSSSSSSSSDDAIKLSIALAMLGLAENPAISQDPEITLVNVEETLSKLVQELPNDKDAREALATFLIRAYALGYRKDQADNRRMKGFISSKSRPLDCMDAQNIVNACLATTRVDPTCEIAMHFLMHCWKYNYKAEDAQLAKGVDFWEDALDHDDAEGIFVESDNFGALDSASVKYIGSAIDANELIHATCERVECLPKDEQSWKYLSTALVGVEMCATGESENAYARQYEIIFQNVSMNRAWWPQRMFANPNEISSSSVALCKYKAIVACIAFPLDERCERYVNTFQTFLAKNANLSQNFSGVISLLSFLKDRVKEKYKRLLTPEDENVLSDSVKTKADDEKEESEEDELKDVEVDDAML